MSDERVHAMIADACFGARTKEDFTTGLSSFLEKHALDREDIEAIVRSPPRLALYRRLVRNNLVGVTTRMLRRTRARLDDGEFDAAFDAFLATVGPRTHYLRDVPAEFLAWAIPRWKALPGVPQYIADFAAHELVEFEMAAAAAAPTPPPLAEVSHDRPLVFAEAKRLVRYAFAVQELPADDDDRTAPGERAVSLLVYRDAEHAVRYLELTPLAASILERLIAGTALGAAIASACAASNVALTEAVLADTARLLADLGERGVLLGAAPL